MKGIDSLVKKAKEFKATGMSDKEIGRELHISVDTVSWLLTRDVKAEKPPSDVKIGWKSVGVYGHRISGLSEILSDILLEESENRDLEIDTIVGVAINGIPFASYISAELGLELAIYRPSVAENAHGTVAANLATVEGKTIAIVDDFVGSGDTMEKAIEDLRALGAKPVLGLVTINKTNKYEINGTPIRSLIRAQNLV